MRAFSRKIGAGFLLSAAALLLAGGALAFYLIWGSAKYAVNPAAAGFLAGGLVLNIVGLFFRCGYLTAAMTGLYGAAMMKVAADNAGSFADAYQGIVMFGDPTQVGTVLTICGLMLAAAVLSIASGFSEGHE